MQKKLNANAQEIAKHGRYGDDRLLHVSQAEIDGLASLVPGGKLPINPKTGLPEAFFFLPFLAALGAAAPAAAGTAAGLGAAGTAAAGLGAAGAAGLGAAALPAATTAAGLGAAGTAAALPAATAATSGLGALGAAAPTAGTAALTAAAPTAAAALPSATALGAGTAGLPSVLAGTPFAGTTGLTAATTAGTGGAVAAPTAATLAPTTAAAANPVAAATGATGLTHAGAIPTIAAASNPALTTAAATPAASSGGLGGLLGGMDTSKLLQYGALGAMMMPRGGGGGGGSKEKEKSQADIGGKQYSQGDQAAAPDSGNQGGVTSEWRYFPSAHYYAKGGHVSVPHVTTNDSVLNFAQRDRDKKAAAQIVGKYAEGGLASLTDQGAAPESHDDEQLIDATVQALQGQAPNSNAVVQEFVQRFGPEALQDLVAQVQGNQQNSDGMSDSVPANISGGIAGLQQQPAQLSEGEYVVPSDVVSHLGNGSSTAGSRQLDKMVHRTRHARGAKAPKQIDPNSVMPA